LVAELLYENEKELLSSLSKGNENALKFIYQRYWERLFISAYNFLHDKEACEDIIQEVFISLWEKRETVTITTSLPSYLFAAVRYQAFHILKKKIANAEHSVHLELQSHANETEMVLDAKELQSRLNVAVENLPEKCRNIYKLSREQHLSNKQIAENLGVSSKTVENQVTIALRKLRFVLSDLKSLFL
jgi:RNA polymerase sigma-70 factor (ECF subfamily)